MASFFKAFLPAMLVLTLLGACDTKIDLEPPPERQAKLVLLGELIAGDSMHLRASRTRSLHDSDLVVEFERDIQISLGDGTRTLALTPYEDGLLSSLYTTLYSNPAAVMPQTEYTVKASKPGMNSVEASVKVPAAFNGVVAAEGPGLHNGDSIWSLHVAMRELPAGSRYVVEILRRPISILSSFWHDGYLYDYDQSRRMYDSLAKSGVNIAVIRDTTFYQGTTRQAFYSDRLSAENSGTGTARSHRWLFIRPEAGPGIDFRIYIPRERSGTQQQYFVRLKSIAADYYDFLKSYELSSLQLENNDVNQPVPSSGQGNVKDGAGMVGGVYLREQQFVY